MIVVEFLFLSVAFLDLPTVEDYPETGSVSGLQFASTNCYAIRPCVGAVSVLNIRPKKKRGAHGAVQGQSYLFGLNDSVDELAFGLERERRDFVLVEKNTWV